MRVEVGLDLTLSKIQGLAVSRSVRTFAAAAAFDRMATQYPEARVLIIMTGGTICMKHSPEGLVPARGFLVEGMAPRPSFNDGSKPGTLSKSCKACNGSLVLFFSV